MSRQEIDQYLADLDEPKRAALTALRQTILDIIPDAEECISYGVPAFRIEGKVIAGFAAFKNHLSYLPHSGSVLAEIKDALGSYSMTKSALHFTVEKPLLPELVRRLIDVRQAQVRK